MKLASIRVDRVATVVVAFMFGNCVATESVPVPTANELTSGTSSIVIEDHGVTLSPAYFNGPATQDQLTPAAGDSVMFGFDFYNEGYTASIECASVAWATLQAASGPLPLTTLCDGAPAQLTIASSSFTGVIEIPMTTGTVTLVVHLDSERQGTVVMQLDIPSTELTGTDGANVTHKIRVAASALVGSQTYGTINVPVGGGCGAPGLFPGLADA
jgi:hypothetical protein